MVKVRINFLSIFSHTNPPPPFQNPCQYLFVVPEESTPTSWRGSVQLGTAIVDWEGFEDTFLEMYLEAYVSGHVQWNLDYSAATWGLRPPQNKDHFPAKKKAFFRSFAVSEIS